MNTDPASCLKHILSPSGPKKRLPEITPIPGLFSFLTPLFVKLDQIYNTVVDLEHERVCRDETASLRTTIENLRGKLAVSEARKTQIEGELNFEISTLNSRISYLTDTLKDIQNLDPITVLSDIIKGDNANLEKKVENLRTLKERVATSLQPFAIEKGQEERTKRKYTKKPAPPVAEGTIHSLPMQHHYNITSKIGETPSVAVQPAQ